jgi:hypothetical protein
MILYLRKEPTPDKIVISSHNKRPHVNMDVVAYHDRDCTDFEGRFPWFYTDTKPRTNCKIVTLNCYVYTAVWLPPLPRL